jgi:hypothetical protein
MSDKLVNWFIGKVVKRLGGRVKCLTGKVKYLSGKVRLQSFIVFTW